MKNFLPNCLEWPPLLELKKANGSVLLHLPKHRGKIYPVDEMEQVVACLSKCEDYTVFLFGGRGYEEAILEQWEFQYPRVKSVVGKYALDNELALISQLDVLLCMDSANMHFASLVGTRVISIWGATHPYAVFMVIIKIPVMLFRKIYLVGLVLYLGRNHVCAVIGRV